MSTPGSEPVAAALSGARLNEPAWVRDGSPQLQREYALGLEFERLLVAQLASSLTETTEPAEGEAGEGASGSAGAPLSVLSSMLPSALAQGVVNGGGLGLAAQLTKGLETTAGASPAGKTGTTGGVSA